MNPEELVVNAVEVKAEQEGGGKASFPLSSGSHWMEDGVCE